MVAYVDGMPVGWCGLGPHGEFERLVRSRTIPPPHDPSTWSVVCFLVRPGFRRRGVATALLEGAAEYACRAGAPSIEGYPVDAEGQRVDATFAYVGTTSLFERVGFRKVAPTAARSAGRPRWVMRLDCHS